MGSTPPIQPEDFDVCPVLLVHPEHDRMTPLALSDAFLARIRAPTRRCILEGAGHMPLEEPGISQLRRAALAFLEACARLVLRVCSWPRSASAAHFVRGGLACREPARASPPTCSFTRCAREEPPCCLASLRSAAHFVRGGLACRVPV